MPMMALWSIGKSSMSIDREQIKHLVREFLEHPAMSVETTLTDSLTDESLKYVITEADVSRVPINGKLQLRVDAILTPSAQDVIREHNLQISYRNGSERENKRRLIALGADHGGFAMKEQLKRFLAELGYLYRDFGTQSAEAVDYPDFAHAVARAVADRNCHLGIIFDAAGIGSCITANKVPGVRAAMCYDETTAQNSREHNYANVLTLGAKMITERQMRKIVQAWLTTNEGEARHGKRVTKIIAIEKQYLRS